LGVTATNVTNLPDALTDGKIASVPTSVPCGSVETSCVEGEHGACTLKQESRKYTWRPGGASASRFVAAELNAM
jgi:hypothetical protein